MIKVTVTSTDVRIMAGTAAKSGKPYSMDFQTVWVHTQDKLGNSNPFPEKSELILEKNAQGVTTPYPIGEYSLLDASVQLDNYGGMILRPVLAPVKAGAALKAA